VSVKRPLGHHEGRTGANLDRLRFKKRPSRLVGGFVAHKYLVVVSASSGVVRGGSKPIKGDSPHKISGSGINDKDQGPVR
jgi:hypothetical protein